MSDGSDLDWLGLVSARPGEWTFAVTPALSRPDGKFYGGTGIAVATAVMEAESGRAARWVSVQFVATCLTGEVVRVAVTTAASGRRTSQLQVHGWVGDRLLFAGIGATGSARPSAVETGFGTMPDVPAPQDCPRWDPLAMAGRLGSDPGWLAISDVRRAGDANGLWLRRRGGALTRPAMAFLADVIPSGVMRAAGRNGAGTSLDNTVRFGPEPSGEWMLADVDPHMVSGGYVHGAARLWSPSGRLLGVASQTAAAVSFAG